MTNHLLYGKVEKNVDKTQLYPTPDDIIYKLIEFVLEEKLYDFSKMPRVHDENLWVMDAGAFDGRWGYRFCDLLCDYQKDVGSIKYDLVELLSRKEVEERGGVIRDYGFLSSALFETDYIGNSWQKKYNIVIGNPPYGNEYKSFWKRSMECLVDNGLIMWLLPSEYIHGAWRKEFVNPYLEYVISPHQRIDFTGAGSPNRNYSFFIYNKSKLKEGYQGFII